MKPFLWAGLLLASSSAFAHDYWCLNNRVSFLADYAYLRRQEVRDLRLVQDDSIRFRRSGGELDSKKVLDTDDLIDRFGWQSAVRVGMTFHANCCSSIEALYTYVFHWTGSQTKHARGTLSFPFEHIDPISDYFEADRAKGRYRSWLQNGEINYWGHVTPQRVNYFSFSWIAGYRMVYLQERLDLFFTRKRNTSLYEIKTFNTLYGAQLGAVLEINPSSCWTWTFILKGAGFLNVAKNEVDIRDRDNAITLAKYEKNRWTDSYLIEAYGQLAYHPWSWLGVHIGYQGFLLTGVATAPEQRDVDPDDRRIRDKGQILIDGLYAGIDLSF
jgi:hypothetical protein